MQPKLTQRTLDLVRERPASLSLAVIASDTGISHDWLKSFASGRAINPPADRVELLYTYLSGRQLEL